MASLANGKRQRARGFQRWTERVEQRCDRHRLKREYVRVNPRPDARTVIEQLPAWFAHYNDVHPHRALRYRSPREFIAQTREAPSGL